MKRKYEVKYVVSHTVELEEGAKKPSAKQVEDWLLDLFKDVEIICDGEVSECSMDAIIVDYVED